MFDQFYTTLESLGIVPVVVLDKVEDAAPLAHALMAAGMKSAEVTFRTACAAECITAMAAAEPEMCVGAGTVLSRLSRPAPPAPSSSSPRVTTRTS